MERLNTIIGKMPSRRQALPEQLEAQGTSSRRELRAQPVSSDQEQWPQQSSARQEQRLQPPSSARRLLPEQMAHQGQRQPHAFQHQRPYRAPMPPKNGELEESEVPDRHERPLYGDAPGRPLYARPRSSTNEAPYQPHQPRSQEEAQRPRSLRPQTVENVRFTDEYVATPRADVLDEWDEEDDGTTGMRFGDWEGESEDVLVSSPRADVLVVPETRSAYSPVVRGVVRAPETESPYRETRDTRLPIPHAPVQPLPQNRRASGPRPPRVTQPLDPRSVAEIGRGHGMSPEVSRVRPSGLSSRQMVPHEQAQVQPYVPLTVAVPASPKEPCPKCRGAGYLRADVSYGHPNFGKPIACTCKEAERKEKRRQQLRELSNLNAFRDSSFRSFNPRVPGVQEAYQEAVEYAKNPDGWLLLVGPNGCGKTHLAVAIANQCLDKGAVVLFSVVPDLLDHLRAAFAPTAAEVYDQLFSKMREAEVLILDDLGAQQSSPWANEKLFQLLNYRYNMEMPTVITANPKGLQGMDERIRSRLMDNSLVVTVTIDRARDYRPHHPRREP